MTSPMFDFDGANIGLVIMLSLLFYGYWADSMA